MARRKSTVDAAADARALIELANTNQFQTFTLEEIAEIFGWGKNVPGLLAAKGAPLISGRMIPAILLDWLKRNAGKVGKLRLK